MEVAFAPAPALFGAARLWEKLEPTEVQYPEFRRVLLRLTQALKGDLEL